MPQRHYSLDYLRAACILYLMGFWHLFEYTGIARTDYNTDITRRGATIVLALFCMISGYLCGNRPVEGFKDLKTYYIGRFWRLYPPFVIATLLFLALAIDNPERLLHGVTLISMFTKVAPRTLWFIDMLVMFYVLAPVFLAMRRSVALSLVTLTGALALAWGYDLMTHRLDWRLFLFLPCFVTGIIFAQKMPKLTWALGVVLIVAWGASAYLTTFIPYEKLKDSPLQIPLGVVSAIALFLVAWRVTDHIRAPRIVEVISYASYFMYLFHRPLYLLAANLLKDASVPVRTTVLIGVVVPVLIALAYILQKLYDRLTRPLLAKA